MTRHYIIEKKKKRFYIIKITGKTTSTQYIPMNEVELYLSDKKCKLGYTDNKMRIIEIEL